MGLRLCSCLAQDSAVAATSELFASVFATPAVQSLARRLEQGGVLSCGGVSAAAQPFLAALLQHLFPQRPIVVVTEGLRTQESTQQDLATWLALGGEVQSLESKVQSPKSKVQGQEPEPRNTQPATRNTPHAPSSPQPLFYPSWEVLPHDVKLPHADVISERLETLVALTLHAPRSTPHAPLVVTSVVALLQRTFPDRKSTRLNSSHLG